MKVNNRFASIPGRLVVILYAICLILPMYFILITAVKTPQEITLNPIGLPSEVHFENFWSAIIEGNMLQCGINSVIVAVFGVTLSMLCIVMLSYSLVKLRKLAIGRLLYSLVIVGMFIPNIGWITMIHLYQSLNLYNTYLGLIVANAVSGISFGVFMVYGFMISIPDELEEAAILDGCTDFQSLWHIVLPVTKPAIITVAILNFCNNWNNMMTPLLLLTDADKYTIPLGILAFKTDYSTNYSLSFAAILLAAIPVVVLYLRFQKYFENSLTGSVKG